MLLRALGFFMRIILSRELGAEALGVYQISQSFFYVLVTVVASGLPATISRLSARFKETNDKETEGSVVSSSLIIGVCAS
ncbi:MAG: oligosaccharide flippase family protein, partial [Clostridia bacterium]|nr:oligosaccharide flippase family protein [Clostridia bacterium]